jgi:hypothetical protein
VFISQSHSTLTKVDLDKIVYLQDFHDHACKRVDIDIVDRIICVVVVGVDMN